MEFDPKFARRIGRDEEMSQSFRVGVVGDAPNVLIPIPRANRDPLDGVTLLIDNARGNRQGFRQAEGTRGDDLALFRFKDFG